MMKHTKTPWGIEKSSDTLWIGRMRPGGAKVDEIVFSIDADPTYKAEVLQERVANAEFIVRACNAHYELLEALRRCNFDSFNMSLEDLEFFRAAYAKATADKL